VIFSCSTALASIQKLMMSLLAANFMSLMFSLIIAGRAREALQARVFKASPVAFLKQFMGIF
jgi:hypothetical protein